MKEENQAVIRALNKYGRVPEQWELIELLDNDEKCITQMNRKMLDLYELYLDYKSRNEKAIELLKNTMYLNIAKAKALNILQGSDEE